MGHGNGITDLQPLVANAGLSAGDTVSVQNDPLNAVSIDVYIPQLQARGVNVIYSTPNTPVGSNVRVDLMADFSPNMSIATISSVSAKGHSVIQFHTSPLLQWGPVPNGYRVLSGVFWEVLTGAVYNGPITGEMHYDQALGEIINESSLRVFQWTGTEWEDVTTSVDTLNNIVYAETYSAGPFFGGESTPYIETATGTGIATLVPDSGSMENLVAVSATSPSTSLPQGAIDASEQAGLNFPHGLFEFRITGLADGDSVALTISLPSAIPDNAQYWKYGPTPLDSNPHWYNIPWTRVSSNTIRITLTDGSWGDDTCTPGSEDGMILDQGGPGWPWPTGGGTRSAPAFPSIYIGIGTAMGAGILAYLLRRRLAHS
jgi:hypothetical protein